MLKKQRVVISLSGFSLASLIVSLGVYIDFRRTVKAITSGDWGAYLELSNSHPGGAINHLLRNLFHYLGLGRSVVLSSVEFYLSILFGIALLCQSCLYIYKIFRKDSHSSLFITSGIFNGMFHIIIQLGLLDIYLNCYPNPQDWCGFYGAIAIALVAQWFLLLSVVFLLIDNFKHYRHNTASRGFPSETPHRHDVRNGRGRSTPDSQTADSSE